jgi:hypothetical protein
MHKSTWASFKSIIVDNTTLYAWQQCGLVYALDKMNRRGMYIVEQREIAGTTEAH